MKVVVEILAGPGRREPKKSDMDINIAALERVIEGKLSLADLVLLQETKSILEGIKRQLPK